MTKTFKIITFGCRTNQAESRTIGEQLCRQGWKQTGNKPDLVIFNTCAVTTKAEREIRKEIRRIKRQNPKCFLVVTGCWAERIKKFKDSRRRSAMPDFGGGQVKIDLMVGNQDKEKIPSYCSSASENFLGKTSRPAKCGTRRINDYQDKYSRSGKAMVKIQDGCDNFCTYCIVPYLRGRSKSVPEIIKQINQLVDKGIKEVILTGIDLADFKFNVGVRFTAPAIKRNGLVELLKMILAKTKIEKISFGSINLEAFTGDFIDFWSKGARDYSSKSLLEESKATCNHFSENLLRDSVIRINHKLSGPNANISSKDYFASFTRITTHFHIPLQSGCDQTLKRMKRKYTSSEFLEKIRQLKKIVPEFSFSTDIIVGFPGETETEFTKSLKYFKSLKKLMGKNFTKIHVFRYSPREGTAAASMAGRTGWEQVDEEEKKKRAKAVVEIMKG